jgi:hypothetical protein
MPDGEVGEVLEGSQEPAKGLPIGTEKRQGNGHPKATADNATLAKVGDLIRRLEWSAEQTSGFLLEYGSANPSELTQEALQRLVSDLEGMLQRAHQQDDSQQDR